MPMTLTGNSKRQREKQNMEDDGFKLINLKCLICSLESPK